MAIGILTELYLPSGEQREFLWNYCENRNATPDEVSENILKLRQLGRTSRWQNALTRWNIMVQSAKVGGDFQPSRLRWAYLQGLVFASHAS